MKDQKASQLSKYTVIQNWLFEEGISFGAILLYGLIDSFNRNGQSFFGSNAYLSETLKITERQIGNLLKELEYARLIVRVIENGERLSIVTVQKIAKGEEENFLLDGKKLPHIKQVIKEDISIYSDFVDRLNLLLGKRFGNKDKKAQRQLSSLLIDHSMEEVLEVVSKAKSNDYLTGNNPGKVYYLTPEYITRPDKFDFWSNQAKEESQSYLNSTQKIL